jgi:hypothetical protein
MRRQASRATVTGLPTGDNYRLYAVDSTGVTEVARSLDRAQLGCRYLGRG